ncbi:MAG: endonuclease/exonuclease/phosphatase family protein [Gammaproteobacteria bacterium]|nr:endonuclease/exonuclease/phosphatase family protein [Gammaproteobacteria bacterium]
MLKVLTYNIHKGFDRRNREFVLHEIRRQIESIDVDVVFLQEIQGRHFHHEKRISGWPAESQFEFLADRLWPHFAYGKNAIYDNGHHGNAILSKHAFEDWQNINFSRFKTASRSLLHGVVRMPERNARLHLICTHLELIGFERKRQIEIIRRHMNERIEAGESVILAGDFNDWHGRMGQHFESQLSLEEAHKTTHGKYAKTFPANWPILQMDRVYYRQLKLLECECLNMQPWGRLSDHLPLYAQFSFPECNDAPAF